MNFENNPIADRVEKQMRSLQKSGVKLNAGSEYNRVFEAFYDLFKRLDESEPSPGEDVQRMAEQTIKEIAGIAWKGAANAFRMYPENKHTFFGYWDAAKNQFAGYSAHPPAPAGMEEAVSSKIKKYQGLINSLELHIKTSNPNETELFAVRMRINTYKDIISDLTALSASTPPAKDNWVKIKPHFKEECVFITRSTYTRNNEPLQYDYTIWQTKWLMGEDEAGGDAFYLALLTGDGEEWGDLNDLEADEYLILFTLPTPPTT